MPPDEFADSALGAPAVNALEPPADFVPLDAVPPVLPLLENDFADGEAPESADANEKPPPLPKDSPADAAADALPPDAPPPDAGNELPEPGGKTVSPKCARQTA